MITTIETPFTLSDADREYINTKIDDLTKYEKRMTQVNVFFKKGDGKIPDSILAEIRIRVPGSDVFAENTAQDAIKSFSEAYNAVKRQLKDRRDQLNDHRSEVKEISAIVNDNF